MRPESWQPVEIERLEPRVDAVVRGNVNSLVIAGPGAGKTELLAQRACYLLQTGTCPFPRRILALSFKRDAAKNLGKRVLDRCGPDLSRRFESYTYYAFSKHLLDRFILGVPVTWRPSWDYQISTLTPHKYRTLIDQLPPAPPLVTTADLDRINTVAFTHRVICSVRVFDDEPEVDPVSHWAAQRLWNQLLHQGSRSNLTFPMITALATLLLGRNADVLAALRATYSHVFLDEFQDTTKDQFQLVDRAFRESHSCVTAVGDNKQRIMIWAGALTKSFQAFNLRFKAIEVRPLMNYRSAPELVRIQSFMMQVLDADSEAPVAHDTGRDGDGDCDVLLFADQESEAVYLAGAINTWMQVDGLRPRQICILVKLRADVYAAPLMRELEKLGIRARIEAELQDLLAEPIGEILLDYFKIVIRDVSGAAWSQAVGMLRRLHIHDEHDSGIHRIERELSKWCQEQRLQLTASLPTLGTVKSLARAVVGYVGEEALRTVYSQYSQGEYMNKLVDQFADSLWESYLRTNDWSRAISDYEGVDAIPIMTIHKSKGLEYHTVVFVGLEDDAFFSFKRQSQEDKCAFFVAFSRARKRVIFTFSRRRVVPRSFGRSAQQSKEQIGELYEVLQRAGIAGREVL